MHLRTLALGLLGATMLTGTAAAQDAPPPPGASIGVETVTVTARRRPENLEKVPVAVTPVSGAELRQNDVKAALDLQNLSPSLTVSANLSSRDDDVFTIRGQSEPFGGADPGVQTYFNEVPFNASGPGSYYDMDNIQVLRGPQGTLFGRSTTGGAVLFQPKRPTDEFGGYVDAETGNYAMREVQGAINIPIAGDDFAVRAAGDIARRDGFTKDLSTNSDLDNVDYEGFRIGATMKPFAGFQNYAVFDYTRDDTHGTGAELTSIAPEAQFETLAEGFGLDPMTAAALVGSFYPTLQYALANQQALGPRKTTSSIPLFFKHETWGVTDIAEYALSDNVSLRNIFGYRHDSEQPAFDYDGSFLPILDIPNPRAPESDSKQISEEFQVQGHDELFDWILGYFYQTTTPDGYSEVERDVFGGANGPFPLLGSTETDSLFNGGHSSAIYGSATYNADHIVKGLSMTFGARYSMDEKIAKSAVCVQDAGDPACPFPVPSTPLNSERDHARFEAPTWTAAANYQVTDDTLLYATYRRGYKSGGFNSGAAGTGLTEFKPEYLTDVELGTKNNWTILGVPGRTNFDIYYGWYQDVQKNDEIAIETIPFPPAVPPPPRIIALTANAARATIKGLEFESTFVPNENFQFTAFYSYTDATYDKFVLPQAIVIDPLGNVYQVNPLDHKGDPFAYTPTNKLGLTGRFHLPVDPALGMPYINATWYWQSKVWFTDLSNVEPHAFQSPYGLLNLRFDWDNFLGSTFDASLFCDNVTDKTYEVGANALEHLTGTTSSIYGAPRMYGVELRYRFGAEGAE